jgi:hypothetical protein
MIDPLSATIVVTTFAAGWVVGRISRRKVPPGPVLPICLCGHHYGAHDPKTGACGTRVRTKVTTYHDLIPCACARYTGPQPVEQYWVPPAADMNIVTAPRAIEEKP